MDGNNINNTNGTAVTTVTQRRWKSWPLWMGVAGAAWTLLTAIGVPQKIGLTNEAYTTALEAAGTILALFGVVNNPTSKSSL